jgi:hypothetical protein
MNFPQLPASLFRILFFKKEEEKKILGKEPEIVSTKQYITKNIRIKNIRCMSVSIW